MSDKWQDLSLKQEELDDIVANLVEELREMDDGTEITTFQLLMVADYDLERFTFNDLLAIDYSLRSEARKNHIRLDMSKHKDKAEGLPFNLDFKVHNTQAQIKCPHCDSTNTARIIYGTPIWTDELEEKESEGKIKLGGSGVSDYDPSRYCNSCRKYFGYPPLLIDRRKGTVEDYRNIVEGVVFENGNMVTGYKTVGIKRIGTGKKNGAEVRAGESDRKEPSYTGHISMAKWNSILEELYTRMYLAEWKKRYVGLSGADGEQWQLEVWLTGNRIRTYRGSNDYPPYWEEMKHLFNPFLKEC